MPAGRCHRALMLLCTQGLLLSILLWIQEHQLFPAISRDQPHAILDLKVLQLLAVAFSAPQPASSARAPVPLARP